VVVVVLDLPPVNLHNQAVLVAVVNTQTILLVVQPHQDRVALVVQAQAREVILAGVVVVLVRWVQRVVELLVALLLVVLVV
jgi:hypothetical protein